MRALRGMVIGVFCLLTGCVAYGPRPAAFGYGYVPSYSYTPAYIAPFPTVVVPIVRSPRYYHPGHRRWRG